jgi:protein SCO1
MNTSRRHSLAVLLAWQFASTGAARSSAPRLPVLGPAPAFALDSSQGARVTFSELRGKVLVVTFVFTTCTATCPALTAKLADIARALGRDFVKRYAFVAISVDPLNDTPTRLRDYAAAHGVDVPGWFFLTGAPGPIGDVVQHYGAYAKQNEGGGVDHLYLTSLVDRTGLLRVQYLGTRFDRREMQRDLERLARE